VFWFEPNRVVTSISREQGSFAQTLAYAAGWYCVDVTSRERAGLIDGAIHRQIIGRINNRSRKQRSAQLAAIASRRNTACRSIVGHTVTGTDFVGWY
jgi:hypothetical protein